ncbi:MAG TPA: hypothetical protein P5511_08950, partial [Candidatus Goldiibacteriota bacterium]|nr:hypothetical protein [Candidatus Goldiibacteriota bacterium]
MKKIIISLLMAFMCFSAQAAITGAQNDNEAAFFEGKKKIASWTFNADGSIQAMGRPITGEVKVYYAKGDKQRFVTYKLKDSVIEDGTYVWAYTSGEPAGEET